MVNENIDGSYPEGSFSWINRDAYDHLVVLQDTFHGCVLSLRERNLYHDSDFFATVWDNKHQCAYEILYASTRFWSYPCAAIVDATDEVKKLYADWCADKQIKWNVYDQECKYYIPKEGKLAKSLTTRGKAKNLEGEIFWIGKSQYTGEQTVGIRNNEGRKAYVALDRVLLWYDKKQEWVTPANYSRTFNTWVIPETTLPSPK